MTTALITAIRRACTGAQSADTFGVSLPPRASLDLAREIVRGIVADQHDRPSLVAAIAVEIGAEIVEGIREPGSDLNSVDLARNFNTSRTPIREALMLLEREALISIPPRRRPKVMTMDIAQVREIYQVRARLLELAAAHIAAHAGADELEAFRQLIVGMARAQSDVRAFLWCNVAFHDQMTVTGGNRLAKTIVDSLLLRTLPMRRLSLSQPGRVGKSLDDHQRLVRAFEERDVSLATALVRSNHRSALETIERVHGAAADPPDFVAAGITAANPTPQPPITSRRRAPERAAT
jgi:DNA-binding GntR family transcriptional regulator